MKRLIFFDLQPLAAIAAAPSARQDEVDVRMEVLDVSAPSMQYAKESYFVAAKVLVVRQQCFDVALLSSEGTACDSLGCKSEDLG